MPDLHGRRRGGTWLTVCLLACSAPPIGPAAAPPPASKPEPTLWAGGHVTKVLAPDRVVVSRGSDDGMALGRADLTLHPLLPSDDGKHNYLEVDIRIARGEVVEVRPTESVLRLSVIAEPVQVGAFVQYRWPMPAAWRHDPLLECAAMDIELRSLDRDEPMFRLADLLRQGPAVARPPIIAALHKEVLARAEMARDVYTVRVEGGDFHSLSLADAMARTTPAHIEKFLGFVRAFPGKYIGHRWKFVEVYATWIINRTPDGDRDVALRTANPLLFEGNSAAERGDFKTAEDLWRQALAVVPDLESAKARIKSVNDIRVHRDVLSRDPDDSERRYKLMLALFDRAAYALASEQLDKLERVGFRSWDVQRYRGMILVRQGQYQKGLAILRAAEKDKSSAALKTWLTYAEQMAAIQGDPKGYAAKLALGKLHEEERLWDSAIAQYHAALDAATDPVALAEAHRGQKRVAVRRDVASAIDDAEKATKKHENKFVRDKVNVIVRKLGQIGESGQAAAAVGKIAAAANSWWETKLALELRLRQVKLAPKDADAWLAIAWLQLGLKRPDQARKVLDRALLLKPESHYAHLIAAQAALDQDDLVVALAEATTAANDPNYAWPRQTLAQIAAAQGDYATAERHAEAAWKLLPDDASMRNVRLGARIAHQAHKAMAAGKDVDRNRLRLIRALVWMDAPRAASAASKEMARTSKYWSAARRAFAEATGDRFDPAEKAAAAQDFTPASPGERVLVERCAAEAAMAATETADNRLRLGRAYLAEGSYHRTLATLGSPKPGTPEADLYELARLGLQADEVSDTARQAGERSDHKSAEALYEKAWQMLQKVHPWQADQAVYMVVAARHMQGRQADAHALLGPHIERLRGLGESYALLDLLGLQADLEAVLGNLGARRAYTNRALAICEEEDNYYCLANLSDSRGRQWLSDGKLAQAKTDLDRAVALADLVGNDRLLLNAQGSLADLHLGNGDLPAVRAIAEPMLVKARKLGDAHNERFALMLLGAAALDTGDGRTAVRYFGDVYELGVRVGDNWVRALARLYEGKAHLYGLHDPKTAEPLLQQAAELYGRVNDLDGRARCLIELGVAHTARKQFGEGRAALASALQLARVAGRKPQMSSVFAKAAQLELDAGQAATALPLAQSATDLAEEIDIAGSRFPAWHVLAVALDKTGNAEGAYAAHEKAVAALVDVLSRSGGEAARDGSLSVGRTREVFRDAVDHCMRTGRIEKALEWLELSRDATLRRIFDPSKLKAQDQAARAELDKIRQAEQQVAASKKALHDELAKPEAQRNQAVVEALGKVVASNDREFRQLMVQLNAKNPRMYQALSIKAENLRDLQKSIPEGTVVVQYFASDDALYAFVITRDGSRPKAVKVEVSAADLEKAIFGWRDTVAARNPTVRGGKRAEVFGIDPAAAPAANKALGRKLYNWLLAPIAAELAGAQTVMIVPYGSLYYLPVHALESSDPAGKPFYAIEKQRIGYLSAATRFQPPMAGPRPPRTLLAFANPDGTLPGARTEVERLQRDAFPDARVFYEKDATKARFESLAQNYRVVHFATHGILAADATKSHLKMADAPLTVFDIHGLESLDGKTDLVVLSACETALQMGKSAGEELISVASAFANAGAPSLVASLWEVDDDATAELMTAFYRLIKAGKDSDGKPVDTLEALRQAQLHVLRLHRDGATPYADPAFWAAFQLIGEYR